MWQRISEGCVPFLLRLFACFFWFHNRKWASFSEMLASHTFTVVPGSIREQSNSGVNCPSPSQFEFSMIATYHASAISLSTRRLRSALAASNQVQAPTPVIQCSGFQLKFWNTCFHGFGREQDHRSPANHVNQILFYLPNENSFMVLRSCICTFRVCEITKAVVRYINVLNCLASVGLVWEEFIGASASTALNRESKTWDNFWITTTSSVPDTVNSWRNLYNTFWCVVNKI